jgi:hypothetical protein
VSTAGTGDTATQTASSGEYARRARASRIALWAAAAFFLIALVCLLLTEPAPTNQGSTVGPVQTTSTTGPTATPGAKPPEPTSATTSAPDTSLLGRTFSSGAAPFLFQVLLAGAGAFLVGAIVQRIQLGEYGVTLGPVSLPSLAPVTESAATAAVDSIKVSPTPPRSARLKPGPRKRQPRPQFDYISDDRLALITIRVELEYRLRKLAEAVGVDEDLDLKLLPRRLASAGQFDYETAQGYVQLLSIGDRIAAGAQVEPKADTQLRDRAGPVLYGLRELERRALAERSQKGGG